MAVSPNGSTVFVAGYSLSATKGNDYATIAYNAATGAQRWAARYNGVSGGNYAHALAVSPNGKSVFVTGSSIGAHDSYDYATVAYNAVTGAQRWAERYDGPGSGDGQAYSAAVSPSGATLFVTGYTDTSSTSAGYDYATVAYNAATGSRRWIRRHDGAGGARAHSVAVSRTTGTVFVTGYSGESGDYATIAYKG